MGGVFKKSETGSCFLIKEKFVLLHGFKSFTVFKKVSLTAGFLKK
jgi:hypothetical protein